ncbi:MAG: hypothetical protein M1813_001879 [Trichoglossum hirsutum]|nr:MAG: hypothetical protein M1813_001879 [Trichoglossum hirsutum]
MAQSGRSLAYPSVTARSTIATTELECNPTTTDVSATTASGTAESAVVQKANAYTSIYQFIYLELCSTGLRPVTTTVTGTYIDAIPTAVDALPRGFGTTVVVCSICAAEPTVLTLTVPCLECLVTTSSDTLVVPMPAYTTMTIARAPSLPEGLTTSTTTSSTLVVVTWFATSNRGILNASVLTSAFNRSATTVQPFSGDATVMSLSFPFVVSVIGIVIAGIWFL